LYRAKGGFLDGFRFTDKGHHGAVGALARVYIQQPDSLDAFNYICDLFDDCQVTAF
jgi:hypothetical protein